MEYRMSLSQGRIVRAGQGCCVAALDCNSETPTRPRGALPEARVVRREAVNAGLRARELLKEAHDEAAQIVAQAHRERDHVLQQARRDGLDQAAAELAAGWVALRDREVRADEATLQRSIELARLLAERMLRETLQLHPEAVVVLAREATAQFWQARAITIHAHPQDAEVLRAHLSELSVKPQALDVREDGSRSRGSLRFTSDLGALDADLAPQLQRLVESLRRALAKR
jgi:flagellar biosynthesis/type III secretory pathway protein FliH